MVVPVSISPTNASQNKEKHKKGRTNLTGLHNMEERRSYFWYFNSHVSRLKLSPLLSHYLNLIPKESCEEKFTNCTVSLQSYVIYLKTI